MKKKVLKAFKWYGDFVTDAFIIGMLFIGATYCFDEARNRALERLYKPKVYHH